MNKISAIEAGKLIGKKWPIYVIVGEEVYLANRALEHIEKAHGQGKSVFYGKGLDYGSFYDSARNASLFGAESLIIIRDAEALSKDVLEKMASYIDDPSPCSSVVFIAGAIDGRSRFMQRALKSQHTSVIECKPLYPNQIPRWINFEVMAQGKKISKEAAEYLADITGTDLSVLSQTIERLSLFKGNKPLIELCDVEECTADVSQRSIFELTDAVGSKDLKRALLAFENLIRHGTFHVVILAMIARHMRILIKAKEVSGAARGREIASYLGVNPYFADNYMNQSRNFSVGELKNNFRILAKADAEIKSSRVPKEEVLKHLLLTLVSGRRESSRSA